MLALNFLRRDICADTYRLFLSPLEHFEIKYLSIAYLSPSVASPYSLTFTIDSLTIYYLSIIPVVTFIWWLIHFSIISRVSQFFFENFYDTIMLIVKNQSNSIRNFKSFTILYFIFIFIIFLNFFSLSPFTTSVSGHIMIALSLSLVFFISFIFEGFLNNRLNFLYFFYPSNVPAFLLFFLIIIEVLSFLIRPFSLAIRLFANMLAGHTLLNIFGTFALFVADDFSVFHIFPYIFCLLIGFLEFGVAFIQAYVFVILLSIYISDITIVKH